MEDEELIQVDSIDEEPRGAMAQPQRPSFQSSATATTPIGGSPARLRLQQVFYTV